MTNTVLPTFSLETNHLYKVDSTDWRFVYRTKDTVTLSSIADPHRKATYEIGTLNRLNAAGKIEMVPFGLLPEEMRPAPYRSDDETTMAGLDPASRKRAHMRRALVLAYEDHRARGDFKVQDDQIKAAMPMIRETAAEILAEFDIEHKAKLRAWREGEGRKPQTKNTVAQPDNVCPRQLRAWVKKYRQGGIRALVDSCKKRGNVNSYFTADEMSMIAKAVNEHYLKIQGKTIVGVTRELHKAIKKENEKRFDEGKQPLRFPSRAAVSKFIQRLNTFHVLVAREGQQAAMNKMRPVSTGVEVSRPLERVEIDEWKIDLLTILVRSGFVEMFAPEERERLGLDDKKRRWWLVMAIDCRTRVILGMVLTANPTATAALKCLRMIVSDKGQFADKIGALNPWSMFGTPEAIFVDNGSALASALFTDACGDLGIQKVQTIAGMASMRGHIESVFNSFAVTLMPRLSGRTYGNVIERGNHPSEKRACHDVETLATILVRYAVDVYHTTAHSGLGGRTPLDQWEADHKDGNYPLLAAPSIRKKRIALGLPLERHVRKDGIVVMNVHYRSARLAEWYLANGDQVVDVRWFDENIGSIEVKLDGAWYEVPAATSAVKDVDATTWAAARRALFAKDPKRKEWEEHVVAKALADIDALNANRMAAYHIMDHGWSAEALQAVTDHASSNFQITLTTDKTTPSDDGYGQSIKPQEPEHKSVAKQAFEHAEKQLPVTRHWTIED